MENGLNSYGIVAGWHMFRLADEAANKFCHAFETSEYWLTKLADCQFYRQVAANEKLTTTTISGSELYGDSYPLTVFVKTENETPVARFRFVFVKRDHLSVEVQK